MIIVKFTNDKVDSKCYKEKGNGDFIVLAKIMIMKLMIKVAM